MKKYVTAVLLVAVVAVAFGAAGLVHAQTLTPQAPVPGSGFGYGQGMGRGARGGMMGSRSLAGTQDGLLHDEMITIFAEKLGLSVDTLNTRLAAGETMSAIALSTGMTIEEFQTLMIDVRSQALDQAVTAGTLTLAQADFMKTRGHGQMMGTGTGRGVRGAGMGQFSNPDCPYNTQTQP